MEAQGLHAMAALFRSRAGSPFTYTDAASRSAYYQPPDDVIETTGRVVDDEEPPKEDAIVPR